MVIIGNVIPQSIINKAVEECLRSTHNPRHGAVIFKGKRVYSVGYNTAHRSVKSIKPNSLKWDTSVHAEVAAILNAKRDLHGFDMLVVRLNNKRQFMLSKPCVHCQAYLEYVGIRNVYYSILNYPFIEEI